MRGLGMRVLIIGGAGYIGSHVAWELAGEGRRVTLFDNLSSGLRENVDALSAHIESFIEGDILDYDALTAAMKGGFDALVHLAAFKAAGESMSAPEKYSRNNISGTINILNAALENGIRFVVFSSSAAVYGEPQRTPVDEAHPTQPENYYGFTKLEIERIMAWYDKLKGLRSASLRYFNAAGYDTRGRMRGLERNPANLLPVVMEAAAGIRKELTVFGVDYPTADGSCIRDYVHVNDLAAGHRAALDYLVKTDTSVTVNLGSGAGVSVLEMLGAARKICGAPIPAVFGPRRAGDPASLTASITRARELLGWQPRYSDIETLIRSTWEVYRK